MFQGGVWEKGYEVLKLRGRAGPNETATISDTSTDDVLSSENEEIITGI